MNIPAIIAIIVMIIGFMSSLIYPMIKLKEINSKTVGYKKVKGEVIDFIENFHYHQFERKYYPIVKYNVDNKDYKMVGKVGYGLSLFMPKKLIVMYNPQNPNEAVLSNEKNLMLIVIIAFSIGILSMTHFLINDLILDNTMKYYEYKVTCNISGYVYDKLEGIEAKSKEEALILIKEKYKTWKNCDFNEVNPNTDGM